MMMPFERAATSPELSDFAPAPSRTRRVKGEDHIPRPPNSFMCYRSDMCRKHKMHPLLKNDLTVHPSRHVADMWKSASAEIRDFYKEVAKQKADEHKRLYPEYKYSPVHTQRKGKPTKASLARQRKAAELGVSSTSSASTPPPATPIDLPTPMSFELPSLSLTSPMDLLPPPMFMSAPPLAAPRPQQAFLPSFAEQSGPSMMVPFARRRSSAVWLLGMGHRRSLSCPTSAQLPFFQPHQLHQQQQESDGSQRPSLDDADVTSITANYQFPPMQTLQQNFDQPDFNLRQYVQELPVGAPPMFLDPFTQHHGEPPIFTDPFAGEQTFLEQPGCGDGAFNDPFNLHGGLRVGPRGSLRHADWSPESTPESLQLHSQASQHAQLHPDMAWSSSQEPSPIPGPGQLAMEDILTSPAMMQLGSCESEILGALPDTTTQAAFEAQMNALMLHQ